MKKYLVALALLLITITAGAVPAKKGLTRTITLQNGETVQATLVGDEYGHYWLTQDGRSFRQVSDADYFVEVDAAEVKTRAASRRAQSNARRVKRLPSRSPQKIGEFGDYTGNKKGIIILVNFSDVKFKNENNNELFDRIANEVNFTRSQGSFVGSVHDYFYAQSGGVFNLTFDVVGPYDVSNTQSYYGSNDSEGNDKHPAEMVIEALQMANADVNFRDYDWDGDNEVDQVYVIYAGKGEADGGASTTIWPHEWQLSAAHYYGDGSGAITLDGVKIDTYACGGELNGSTGTVNGIGTLCHEFSHCLGYPDFYDVDYSGGQGMGEWDLMDSGSYNGTNSNRPAGYTSYERWMAGWMEPIELNAGRVQVNNLNGLQDGGESYIIYNDGNRNEYFMLENRSNSGWDKSIPGFGLLILHVDYSKSVWEQNSPNNDPNHQRMTWIPADNNYQYAMYQGTKYYTTAGMANDPFPYGSVNAFDNNTTPAATLYNKNTDGSKLLNKGVYNITKNSDGTISFLYKGASNVQAPTFSPEAGTFTEPVDVTISANEGATIYYTTDGTTPSLVGSMTTQVYSSPIHLETTTTLKAMAVMDDEESDVVTAKYVIKNVQPSTGDYVWKEDWTGNATYTAVEDVANPNASYEGDGGAYCKIYNEARAGGTAPELLIPMLSREINYFTATIAMGTVFGELPLSFKCNRSINVSTSTTGASVVPIDNTNGTYNYKVTVAEGTSTLQLTFSTISGQNARIDDILLAKPEEVKPTPNLAFSVTELTALPHQQDFTEPTLTNPYSLTVVYSSSKADVAAVDAASGEVTIGNEGTAVITALYAGDETYAAGSASYTITVARKTAELSFSVNEVNTYPAVENFTEPTLNNPQELPVTFSSSNKKVATVNAETGKVTIVNSGTTVIKALFAGNDEYQPAEASYTIIVEKKDGFLEFSHTEVTAKVGDEDFEAPTLSNPYAHTVVYSSSDESVATVDDEHGYVTIGKAGTTTITASFAGNDEFTAATASYTLTVTKNNATLSFNPTEITIEVGTENIEEPVLDNQLQLPVTYKSDTPTIVAVNTETGELSIGTATGTAVITATFAGNDYYESCSASYTVTVVPKTIVKQDADLSFEPVEVTVEVGTEDFDEPVLNNPNNLEVTYVSSDETLATVDVSTGEVTIGETEGTVVITAIFFGNDYFNEGTASYTIVITPKPIVKQEAELSFTPEEVTVEAETEDFEEPVLNNPHELDVTYASSDETLATVDAVTGEVTIGTQPGTVVITATFAGNDYFLEGTANYTITITERADVGIRMLQALVAEGHDVFDMQGRKVNVNSLPKGIYICNGRKVVVK